MSCSLKNQKLNAIASGETWPGLSFAVTSSDDTEYGAALSRVRMTWKDSAARVQSRLPTTQVTGDGRSAWFPNPEGSIRSYRLSAGLSAP